MDKDKPPVLSEEEINKWCEEHKAGKGGICYVANSCEGCKRTIQRDADVEHYEKQQDEMADAMAQAIRQARQDAKEQYNKELGKEMDRAFRNSEVALDKAVKQARQETADNILETIKSWLERHAPAIFPWNGWNGFMKELKSKFLGGSQ